MRRKRRHRPHTELPKLLLPALQEQLPFGRRVLPDLEALHARQLGRRLRLWSRRRSSAGRLRRNRTDAYGKYQRGDRRQDAPHYDPQRALFQLKQPHTPVLLLLVTNILSESRLPLAS